MSIAANLRDVKSSIKEGVTLVAVSKTKPVDMIMETYKTGQRVFGENKPQELVKKYEEMPKDIEWHMIGHLQTNKVKYIAPFVSLIHSVDSLKLMKVINKEAAKNNRIINCLLQFHIAEEETKFGFSYQEIKEIMESSEAKELMNICFVGVMGMATFTENEEQVRKEFKNLKSIFERVKADFFSQAPWFKEISMGMSGDYLLAMEEGSTMVRVGSSIFGKRVYLQ